MPLVHTSPIGLVPKGYQVNKWRMIVDLSSPAGSSINDGISDDLCSMLYSSVDNTIHIIRELDRGTQLVKLDIKDAYHITPVHPANYCLLGICWQGNTYVDCAMAFGPDQSPKFSMHLRISSHGSFIVMVLRISCTIWTISCS